MIRNKSVIEVKAGDRVYSLYCECESSLYEVRDVLSMMRSHVEDLIKKAQQKEEDDNDKDSLGTA